MFKTTVIFNLFPFPSSTKNFAKYPKAQYFLKNMDFKDFELNLQEFYANEENENEKLLKRLSALHSLRNDMTSKEEKVQILQTRIDRLEKERIMNEGKAIEIDLLTKRVHQLEHNLVNQNELHREIQSLREEIDR